jgi:hypothetical protein
MVRSPLGHSGQQALAPVRFLPSNLLFVLVTGEAKMYTRAGALCLSITRWELGVPESCCDDIDDQRRFALCHSPNLTAVSAEPVRSMS